MNTNKTGNFLSEHKYAVIFFVSLFIYLTFGFWLNLHNDLHLKTEWDFFSGMDIGFKFNKFYAPFYSYATVILHPFILTLIDPFIKIVKIVSKNPTTTMVLCQSITGGLSNLFFYHCLTKLKINGLLKYLLTCVFILCFSNLIFATFPEFYVYSGLAQMLLLLYAISCLYSDNKKTSILNIFTLALLSTFAFGINFANIISALIMSLFVIFKGNNFKPAMTDCGKYLLILLALITSFTVMQRDTRLGTTTFIKPFIQYFRDSHPISQTYFFNKLPHSERLKYTFKGIFVQPVYSTGIVNSQQKNSSLIDFTENQNTLTFIPILIFLLLPIFYTVKNFKTVRNKHLLALLAGVIVLDTLQNYFWEVKSCFLFSQNHLAYLMLLLAILYDNVPKKPAITVCFLFVLWQIYANAAGLLQIERFISPVSPEHHGILYYVPYSLITVIVLFAAIFIMRKLIKKFLNAGKIGEKEFVCFKIVSMPNLCENKFEFYLYSYFCFILLFDLLWWLYVRGYLCLQMF